MAQTAGASSRLGHCGDAWGEGKKVERGNWKGQERQGRKESKNTFCLRLSLDVTNSKSKFIDVGPGRLAWLNS